MTPAQPAAAPGEVVYVSAGGNIDPEANLQTACRALTERFGELTVSPVYRTAAVGFDGDDFLNLVISFTTTEDIHAVNAVLVDLENAAGRDRSAGSFSSRTLDLDLLLYGQTVFAAGKLRVPREDILKYAFVLAPLADMAPELEHPVAGKTMRALWAEFDEDAQQIERLPEAFAWD